MRMRLSVLHSVMVIAPEEALAAFLTAELMRIIMVMVGILNIATEPRAYQKNLLRQQFLPI